MSMNTPICAWITSYPVSRCGHEIFSKPLIFYLNAHAWTLRHNFTSNFALASAYNQAKSIFLLILMDTSALVLTEGTTVSLPMGCEMH